MAKSFWGSAPAKGGASQVDTLIGRQTEIMGDVRFSGGLHVDGKIVGKVVAASEKSATLSVSETGVVEGDVRAPTVVLNGQVIGDVQALEHISLGSHARITGNVYYKGIEMTGGAVINGQMVHEGDEPMPALTHQKSSNEVIVEDVQPLSEGRGKSR